MRLWPRGQQRTTLPSDTDPASPDLVDRAAGSTMPENPVPPTLDGLPLPANARDARVVVITRSGCHLCEQAEATLQHFDVPSVLVDVDADQTLRDLFSDHVPVTYVDGRLLSLWWLEVDALQSALRR